MKKLPTILLCLASAILGGILALAFVCSRSPRIVAQWTQPATLSYASFDPYTLSVLDTGADYSTIPWGRNYELFLGRGPEAPAYGHAQRFTFHGPDSEMQAYIHRSTVEWTPAGVTFREPAGDQAFIPKAAFIGGR